MKKLLAALCLPVLMLSCKKNETTSTVTPVYGSYSSADTIFQMLSVKSKFTTIDAATGGSFYGNSGTRYIIQPNCFRNASGADVTGSVQIEVAEYLKKGDMIFSKALPICGRDPLISGGEVYINATQGGQQLHLKPGYAFQANIPQGGTPVPGMALFTGAVVQDSLAPMANVRWKPATDSMTHVGIVYNGDTISIISDSLHWCNADQFLSSPNYQTFTVTFSINGVTVPAASQIFAYALYDNYKGVWPLGWGQRTGNVYSENHVPNIPVHFAIFGIVNNKFYAAVTGATPTDGMNYSITLQETDPAAFKGQLNNLIN